MEETLLARALAQEDWERAARCLLVGVARALEKLPPDSLEGLLDILGGRKDGPRKGRRKKSRKEAPPP